MITVFTVSGAIISTLQSWCGCTPSSWGLLIFWGLFFKKVIGFFNCSNHYVVFLLFLLLLSCPPSWTIVYISIYVTGAYSTWCIWLDWCSSWWVSGHSQSLILRQEEGELFAVVSAGELAYVSCIENKTLVVLLGGDIVFF